MRKVIVSVAPVAGTEPLIPEVLAKDMERCRQLGAGMCHLHCKTKEGVLTPDISNLTEAFEEIHKKVDIVVQASTGGISDMSIEQRCNPLNYERVESASLNGGSTNLGDAVYINSFEDIKYCASECLKRNITPEIEVFDIGMINNIELVRKEAAFKEPLLFNLVFGHKGSMPATIEALAAFKSFVPKDCLWGVTHYGRDNWTFLAAAIAMGATLVRIGFEDSKYLLEGQDAIYNYELVEKLTYLIRAMDCDTASPREVREILNIGPR